MTMTANANLRKFGFLIAVLVLALDLASKQYFYALLFDPPSRLELLPFFALTPVWNKGVSFGLFPADGTAGLILLVTMMGLVSLLVVYWLWRSENKPEAVACGMVLGGALGNIYDRVRFGAVRDFFDFFIGAWHWPAFNVADSAIVLGAAILLFCSSSKTAKEP